MSQFGPLCAKVDVLAKAWSDVRVSAEGSHDVAQAARAIRSLAAQLASLESPLLRFRHKATLGEQDPSRRIYGPSMVQRIHGVLSGLTQLSREMHELTLRLNRKTSADLRHRLRDIVMPESTAPLSTSSSSAWPSPLQYPTTAEVAAKRAAFHAQNQQSREVEWRQPRAAQWWLYRGCASCSRSFDEDIPLHPGRRPPVSQSFRDHAVALVVTPVWHISPVDRQWIPVPQLVLTEWQAFETFSAAEIPTWQASDAYRDKCRDLATTYTALHEIICDDCAPLVQAMIFDVIQEFDPEQVRRHVAEVLAHLTPLPADVIDFVILPLMFHVPHPVK